MGMIATSNGAPPAHVIHVLNLQKKVTHLTRYAHYLERTLRHERSHPKIVTIRIPAPVTSTSVPAPSSGVDWDSIEGCESNSDPAKGPTGWATTATGNGFYFALQFKEDTWDAYAIPLGLPSVASYMSSGTIPSRDEQIAVAEKVLASQGRGAWPNC